MSELIQPIGPQAMLFENLALAMGMLHVLTLNRRNSETEGLLSHCASSFKAENKMSAYKDVLLTLG